MKNNTSKPKAKTLLSALSNANSGLVDVAQASSTRKIVHDKKLDHNNLRRKNDTERGLLSQSQSKIQEQLTRRALSPPKLRKYPGTLEVFEPPPNSPVLEYRRNNPAAIEGNSYENDMFQMFGDGYSVLSCETKGCLKEIHLAQDLLQDPQFLHIDQSEMPLEIFDDDCFIENDKLPEEWLSIGCNCKIKSYYDGEWQWREYSVKGYNSEAKKFVLCSIPNGNEDKLVKRLNIMFECEDEDRWQFRRETADARREVTKSMMRLDHYLQCLEKNDDIKPIQQRILMNIHHLVLSKNICSFVDIDSQSVYSVLLRRITAEVVRRYIRGVRKAVLYQEITVNKDLSLQYAKLRLPEVQKPTPVPYLGKMPVPVYPFTERRSQLAHMHMSSVPEILGVYLWLESQWETSIQKLTLICSDIESKNKTPMSFNEFQSLQQSHFASNVLLLKKDFRSSFLDQFVDRLQETYDFFQTNHAIYMTSHLYRLFSSFDNRLQTMLRRILILSISNWESCLLSHLNDEKKEVDQLSETATLRIYDSESGTVTCNRKTLIKVFIQISQDSKVIMEPAGEELKAAAVEVVDNAVSGIRTVFGIDCDVMTLMQIEPIVLLRVNCNDPLFSELDAYVAKSIERIKSIIDRAVSHPNKVLEMMKQYEWTLSLDTGKMISNLYQSVQEARDKFQSARIAAAQAQPQAPQAKQPQKPGSQQSAAVEFNLVAYNEEEEAIFSIWLDKIREFDFMGKHVLKVCFDEENYGLLTICASDTKRTLHERAFAIRNLLIDQLMTDCRQQNNEIVDNFDRILTRIGEKPVNEKQLAELRIFIAQSRKKIKEMSAKATETRRRVVAMQEFMYAPNEDDTALIWSIVEYPSRIDQVAKNMEMELEMDKVRMMDRLAVEKEQFEVHLDKLQKSVTAVSTVGDYENRTKIMEEVNRMREMILEAKERAADINSREQVFNFSPTEYATIDKCEKDLEPFYKLWNMISDFFNNKNDWLNGSFIQLDSKAIEDEVTETWKTSYKLSKQLESEFPAASECALKLRKDSSEFKTHLPVIQALASKALRRRHWDCVSELLGQQIEPDVDLSLHYLLDLNIIEALEKVQEIAVTAEKEFNMEKALLGMKNDWSKMEFEVKAYKNSGTYVVSGVDEIVTLLDDHIVKTQTMRGSPYIKPIELECKTWEYQLKYAQNLIDQWIICQRTWLYLEPIFSSEDIMRQLPTEARRFAAVDAFWRKTMGDTNNEPIFIQQAQPEKKLEEKFLTANEKLEEIQKGLTDYLETKRLFFPRFFFLSNDELLEILAQTKEPRAVQPHLNKCFEGIAKVKFESDLKITEMISAQGETIVLDDFVDPESAVNKGNVEKWLLDLERIQWNSIKTQTTLALKEYETIDRTAWTLRWPAQCVIAVSQIYWTQDVSRCLRSANGAQALKEYVGVLNTQLRSIVQRVRGKLTKQERSTLGALTTIDVHARDVIQNMVDTGVSNENDFAWKSQLRYNWEPSWKDGQATKQGEHTVIVRIVNARCLYGYEYLGNTVRLVITPLTDRCYRTMIGAVDLLYGGAPEGPAGTGKTETVKDLSKAVAIQCVVFNCSDGLDYLAMGKFFKGLAGCGSWSCFDEFNRINIEVLSVIAQQILTINKAKRECKERFMFEGTNIKLNFNANVFITMNPGYAGRTDLPDNLKALFRPCAMMVPDYGLIAEIRLYSFGFETARDNAQKIVRVLQLSSEQLSSQKHYDYGMRAVNSILIACGNLRQKLGGLPEWTESKIVLRSINDVNLPKFTVEDIPLFNGITSDLFPSERLPTSDYGELIPCLSKVCAAGITVGPDKIIKLEPKYEFIDKIVQLYEMVLVRHGVMIVGETMSGKTASSHALAEAMTMACEMNAPFEKVKIHTINPKSVSCSQLYGNFDENTHEWSDGILAVTFRMASKETTPDRKWIYFDGPVDAVWIESMNTVLDDNKKLCLNSGEIVKMSDPMTMMFEAEDLEQASPATVSRVGMIFCEARNLDWQPIRNMWIKELGEFMAQELVQCVSDLFDWLFPPCQYFVFKFCTIPSAVTKLQLMLSMTRMMTSIMDFQAIKDSSDPKKMLECQFLMSIIWVIGGCVDSISRVKFSEFLVSLATSTVSDNKYFRDFAVKNRDYNPTAFEGRALLLPMPVDDSKNVFDLYFDSRTNKWATWSDIMTKFSIPSDASFNNIVVPTIDTVRNEWIIDKIVTKGFHVLCTGETGTGKSVTVKQKLLNRMPENFGAIFINFSARTSANQTQDLIDGKLDKRRKGVIGPPIGSKVVVFVDDLNMPAKEVYGAQPPIEILRQWMDHCGWFDRKENSFRQLVDIQFVAAMGPPGGGRTKITQRYVRHFNLLNFISFSDDSLKKVYFTIIEWFFQRGFGQSIKQLGGTLVDATVEVYSSISKSLLPTPTKSHYTFNLRDMSKVFQGILQCHQDVVREKDQLIRLWAHECQRVFQDRLVTTDDRKWFEDLLISISKRLFTVDMVKICNTSPEEVKEDAAAQGLSITYGNYSDSRAVKKIYQEIIGTAKLMKTMEGYLEDYNAMTAAPMNLVLFQNAIEHVSRVSRIINQPYGNCLLVGVGGSGRKSLTKLATFMAEFSLFQIEITKSYGSFEWREDIKKVMQATGVAGKPTVFLIDDSQLVKESFLEDINGILNTGEVANLFNNEEMAALSDSLTKACQEAGVNSASPNEVYNFFIQRSRTNLHIVLTMSPIGDNFRTRLRMFPSLINCCTIDWFTAWPQQALKSVADFSLSSTDLSDELRAGIVDTCVDMQERVTEMSKKYLKQMNRHYYVTPTSYLELLNTFKKLLSKQRDAVLEQKSRYDNGLDKLSSTERQVSEMQAALETLQPQLREAKKATEELLVQIEGDRRVANEKKQIVASEEKTCNVQADAARGLKQSCEADLAEALPALESSIRALQSLDKSQIVEVKAMSKPPGGVIMTMEAVCIMMNVKPDKIKDPAGGTKKIDDYWAPAKKYLLGDPRFLQRLFNFDKDNMDPVLVEQVTVYTSNPDFEPETIRNASVAAAGICKWIHAMVIYNRVAKVVAPKRAALKQAEEDLAEATTKLNEKRAILKEVMDKLKLLEEKLQEAEDKKKNLEIQYDDCQKKLVRAEQLIRGLGGEKTRWSEFSKKLQQRFENITGDIVLSAGVVAYLGAFTSQYRDFAVNQWSTLLRSKGITCSEGFSLRDALGDPIVIRSWIIYRLPNDAFSVENGIIMLLSNRWPLMIDPQGQANRWVKKMEEKNQLKVVKLTQATFGRTLENCIQFGKPLLIENVQEALDPLLEPVLLKQILKVGGIGCIRLGDATIEFDTKFKLYMTTKLANPHYPPELCVKVNLLNYMATSEGLEDQMLGKVVAKERQELEIQREQLILEDAENKRQLKEIEDKILHLLKNAQGNILDDETLINTLADSKKTSRLIEDKVKAAELTQQRIATVRQGYIPVAFQSSQIFFCIMDLAAIDPMYQYSLDWYIRLFEFAIDESAKSSDFEERLRNLNNTFLYTLYRNVCRSLFEKDKLLFSFLLTTKILTGRKQLESSELRFFLQGNTLMDLPIPNPVEGGWLTDKSWGDILAMSALPGFQSCSFLQKMFLPNLEIWKTIFSSSTPWVDIDEYLLSSQASPVVQTPSVGTKAQGKTPIVPSAGQPLTGFSLFQRLCIVRCLRPELVIPRIQHFVSQVLGQKFIEPPPFDLRACFMESSCITPLVFVLTPGADPMTELFNLAEGMGFGNKIFSISLGQGQGPIAERAIEDACSKGTWVCLQNCHLCVSWMATLERICEELSAENIHKDFRLWLTSEPSLNFPAFVLQNGVKMTNEPPKGLRTNLIGTYNAFTEEWLQGSKMPKEFKTLVYSLCFFHAVLRERMKFGPLGWNIRYIFSLPDLRISMDQLKILVDSSDNPASIPFSALAYLAGECNYGGRVTDDKDRRCLMNILSDFYNPDVLSSGYQFSPSGQYVTPDEFNLAGYKNFIKELPFNNSPEVFGLHENASISCALAETGALLSTGLGLQPRETSGEGKSWDAKLEELAKDIESRIPRGFDVERAMIDFPVLYEESMNTVLTQELLRFNRLTDRIRCSLSDVQKALKGFVVMSGELEGMGNAMVVGRVPELWSQVGYPSLKPLGSWVADLLNRLQFLQQWIDSGTCPKVYWISGFFFTQAFVTGTLQNYARKYTIPIDQLAFNFEVLDARQMENTSKTRVADGAVVRGLFLDGCRWDTEHGCLGESRPKELIVQVPFIHLVPMMRNEIAIIHGCPELYTGDRSGTAHVYNCPLYKTSFRQGVLSTTGHSTNFVMFIRLPMAEQDTQKHWIKRGVALLTQSDD